MQARRAARGLAASALGVTLAFCSSARADDEACAKLAAEHKRGPTIATALELGDCFDRAGHVASARAAFDEARVLARQASDEAERRMKELDARQPKVILEGGVSAGTRIRLDGVPIDPAAVGMPIPVSAGTHLLEVSRGPDTWSARVEVAGAGTVRVPLPGPAVAGRAVEPPPPEPPAAKPAPNEEPRWDPLESTCRHASLSIL